jgi:deoxyribodipyrimidine photo-lyase
MKRVRVLNNVEEIPEGKSAVAYWMARDQRVQDNWAMTYAQNLAIKNKFPLHVIFCLTDKFMDSPLRHYKFMFDGLKEVSEDLENLDINFHLLRGSHTTQIPKFVKDFKIGCLISDFSPLRIHREWIDGIAKNIPKNIPFIQVDAHNVVPLWVASDKLEYAAYTIRSKIMSKLDEFLTEFPPVIKHPYKAEKSPKIDFDEALESVKADKSVGEVTWIKPGYRGAADVLQDFINNRLKNYDQDRNNPNTPAISNLSPYFHFGHIAPQRAVLEVKKYKEKFSKSVDGFVEQATVRRELADNFCYYNKNYDNLKSIDEWAIKTLDDHRKDKREYIYTLKQFDDAQTHDHLWNACQLQMKIEGKMNCYMRM